jgi:hypothetical protein
MNLTWQTTEILKRGTEMEGVVTRPTMILRFLAELQCSLVRYNIISYSKCDAVSLHHYIT